MKELERAGAVLQDKHFVYASGKHGSGYINMDPLFPNTELMWRLGVELWLPYAGELYMTVAAPATGGIALAYAVAYTRKYEVDVGSGEPITAAIWADKSGDDFVFERAGFLDHVQGKRVLVVEDLLTTGGSVAKVCRQVESNGGEVIGVSVVVNRGGVTAENLGVPRLESLANVSFEAVHSNDCPMCEALQPIVVDIGHGDIYQKHTNPDYAGGFITVLG